MWFLPIPAKWAARVAVQWLTCFVLDVGFKASGRLQNSVQTANAAASRNLLPEYTAAFEKRHCYHTAVKARCDATTRMLSAFSDEPHLPQTGLARSLSHVYELANPKWGLRSRGLGLKQMDHYCGPDGHPQIVAGAEYLGSLINIS